MNGMKFEDKYRVLVENEIEILWCNLIICRKTDIEWYINAALICFNLYEGKMVSLLYILHLQKYSNVIDASFFFINQSEKDYFATNYCLYAF